MICLRGVESKGQVLNLHANLHIAAASLLSGVLLKNQHNKHKINVRDHGGGRFIYLVFVKAPLKIINYNEDYLIPRVQCLCLSMFLLVPKYWNIKDVLKHTVGQRNHQLYQGLI